MSMGSEAVMSVSKANPLGATFAERRAARLGQPWSAEQAEVAPEPEVEAKEVKPTPNRAQAETK